MTGSGQERTRTCGILFPLKAVSRARALFGPGGVAFITMQPSPDLGRLTYLAAPAVAVIFSMASLTVKLAAFARGGNSLNVSRYFPTTA
jgi:hypothetical protein